MNKRRLARLVLSVLIGLICLAAIGCTPSEIASPTPERATATPPPLPTFTATPIPATTPIPTATLTPTPERQTATPSSLPAAVATSTPTRPAPVVTATLIPTITSTPASEPTFTPISSAASADDRFAPLLAALDAAHLSTNRGRLPLAIDRALEPFYASPANETQCPAGVTDTWYYVVRAEGDLPLLIAGLGKELYIFWRDAEGTQYSRHDRFGDQTDLLSLNFYAPPAAVRVIEGEKGLEMGAISIGLYSTSEAVYQLLRLEGNAWRVVWVSYPDAGEAWASSSGYAEFLGEGIEHFRLTGPIPRDVKASRVFFEFGVYAKQQYESVWERQGDQYVRIEGRIIPTPMTTLSDFMVALQGGDVEQARTFVTDPAIVDQALVWGWGEMDHVWLPGYRDERGNITLLSDTIEFFDNDDRKLHFRVEFVEEGEEWLITSIETPYPIPTPVPEPSLTITIIYDNNEYDERLKTAWGFSCLVERGDLTLLFDTGGDAETLLSNMATLGLDPADADIVVLSHIHGDHVGGLGSILAINEETTVYLPRSFPASFKEQAGAHALVVEVHEPMEIAEGIYTTGELGTGIIEQSLVVVTESGLVVITGCAHPGIVNIVAKAKEITGEEVYLVMGGFHLSGVSEAVIKGIVEDFRELGVQKVAPCHCSGDLARSIFEREYGEDFIRAGVGSSLQI